jgi:ATP adenylyltransferase
MKVMWAPWRMEYILSHQEEEGCIFCPGEDRTQDEARRILYVGPRSMVMMNRFPYANGHLLVAPVRHVPSLDELAAEELLDLLLVVRGAMGGLKRLMSPEGFNVNFHIVPRWNGDTNYMTVLGEVRVIPEHITNTYRRLIPYFKLLKSDIGGDT